MKALAPSIISYTTSAPCGVSMTKMLLTGNSRPQAIGAHRIRPRSPAARTMPIPRPTFPTFWDGTALMMPVPLPVQMCIPAPTTSTHTGMAPIFTSETEMVLLLMH